MKVSITYCVECDYLPLAERLAGAMKASLDIVPDLCKGHDGIFAVSVDDGEIFNNLKIGGHVPSDARIIEMVRSVVSPSSTADRASHMLLDVMNPTGYPPQIEPVSMAPRPDTLKGKTIYLVDARFDDSDRFMIQMQRWFEEHLPETHAVFVSKSGVYTQEDWDLWSEIKEKGDAMIMGVGH